MDTARLIGMKTQGTGRDGARTNPPESGDSAPAVLPALGSGGSVLLSVLATERIHRAEATARMAYAAGLTQEQFDRLWNPPRFVGVHEVSTSSDEFERRCYEREAALVDAAAKVLPRVVGL